MNTLVGYHRYQSCRTLIVWMPLCNRIILHITSVIHNKVSTDCLFEMKYIKDIKYENTEIHNKTKSKIDRPVSTVLNTQATLQDKCKLKDKMFRAL